MAGVASSSNVEEEYLWTCTLDGATKDFTWSPEDPSDVKEDDEADPSVKPGHRLLIKNAILMPSAKKDEVTIVQIEGEGYNKGKVLVPIVAMKGGSDHQTYVDLLVPCPAKLSLLQGEGPIHLVGSHCVDFYGYRDTGAGDDTQDDIEGEDEAIDDKEAEDLVADEKGDESAEKGDAKKTPVKGEAKEAKKSPVKGEEAKKDEVKKTPVKGEETKKDEGVEKMDEGKTDEEKAKTKTPAKDTEKKTPAKEAEKKTPAKDAEKKTPAKDAEKKSPAKDAEKKSPAKEGKSTPSKEDSKKRKASAEESKSQEKKAKSTP